MSCTHDEHFEEVPPECGRCKTPMVEGHGMVCALVWVADIAFAAGVILLGLFWTCLLIVLTRLLLGYFEEPDVLVPIAILSALNSGLLFALSLTCGMRAKWLRHEIVNAYDDYLDGDGSCCGGSCAGSCGDGGCDDAAGCGTEGCSPEGCDDPDCCKKDGAEDEQGCCGGGCK